MKKIIAIVLAVAGLFVSASAFACGDCDCKKCECDKKCECPKK